MRKTKVVVGERLSAEMMYPLIELWLSSDSTQRSICEEYEIKPHTFSYWRNKYEKEVADNLEEHTANSFVPIEVKGDEPKENGYYAEITYKDRVFNLLVSTHQHF